MKEYKIIRKFRGATYQIEIKNPNGSMRGIKSLIVDGKEIAGNIIPIFSEGSLVHVTAVLR
jgi:cellobiose phosphorylase